MLFEISWGHHYLSFVSIFVQTMIASFKAGLWFVQSCRASPGAIWILLDHVFSMSTSLHDSLLKARSLKSMVSTKDISIQSTKNCHMHICIICPYIHPTFIHDMWLNFCHDITFNKVHRFFNGCWNQDGCKPNKTNMNMEKNPTIWICIPY